MTAPHTPATDADVAYIESQCENFTMLPVRQVRLLLARIEADRAVVAAAEQLKADYQRGGWRERSRLALFAALAAYQGGRAT
jgi:hypothetical protein